MVGVRHATGNAAAMVDEFLSCHWAGITLVIVGWVLVKLDNNKLLI